MSIAQSAAWRAALLMALLSTLGCTDETQVMVEVRAGSEGRRNAETLEVTVYDEMDGERLRQRIAVLDQELLATIPLVPEGGDASRAFRVLAQLLSSDNSVLHEAELSDGRFVPGQLERIVLRIGAGGPSDGGTPDADVRDASVDGSRDAATMDAGDMDAADGDAVDAPSCPLCIDEVSAGGAHTCARRGEDVYCFGNNANGQLGVPRERFGTEPQQVPGRFNSISAGPFASAAIRDGELFGWGNGEFAPESVAALGFIRPIAVLQRRCGLIGESGAILCYRVDGTIRDTIDTHAFDQVSISSSHACGVERGTAQVHCWGDNDQGQLGNGRAPNRSATPVRIVPSDRFSMVSVGNLEAAHSCGVSTDGRLLCWGNNDHGQLGRGSLGTDPAADPAPVTGATSGWEAVSVNGGSTCGINGENELFCWGDNRKGQLGIDSAEDNVSTPTRVAGNFRSVSLGSEHTCGISSTDGEAYCWGEPLQGRIGNVSDGPVRSPMRVRITE